MFGNTKRKNSDTEEGELGVNYGHEPIQSRPPKKLVLWRELGRGILGLDWIANEISLQRTISFFLEYLLKAHVWFVERRTLYNVHEWSRIDNDRLTLGPI